METFEKILLIGNKKDNNDISEWIKCQNFDTVIRYNCCDNLQNTYTETTDEWYFGGNIGDYKRKLINSENHCFYKYVKDNIKHHYNITSKAIHNTTPFYNSECIDLDEVTLRTFELLPDDNLGLDDNYIKNKRTRIKTFVQLIIYLLLTRKGCEITICCCDIDNRKFEKSGWHIYPDIESMFLRYFIDSGKIKYFDG